MTFNLLWRNSRFLLKSLEDHHFCVKQIWETLTCVKNDEFHEWMKLVEALLGASKPSRSCSALTWAILCRVQFASLFDIWPLWFGQKLIMQPMQYSKLRSMARCLITEQSNVCIYFQVSKHLRSWASHQCIIKNTSAGLMLGFFLLTLVVGQVDFSLVL